MHTKSANCRGLLGARRPRRSRCHKIDLFEYQNKRRRPILRSKTIRDTAANNFSFQTGKDLKQFF